MTSNIADKFAGRTRWGYLAAFILLLISYIISFVSTQNLVKQSKWVNHSNEVLHSLDNVLRYVTESESAARGYIITNNKLFLAKFTDSQKKTDSIYRISKSLTSDNPVQQHDIDSLWGLIDARFKILEKGISIFDSAHSANPLLYMQYPAVMRMNEVEKCVRFIQNNEIKLLHARSSRATKYSTIIKAFTVISLLLAILLTLYSVITFNKENREKLAASGKANAYRLELEKRVEELKELNLELLELRNLEKFASTGRIARTIAHEVRNPLTNINLALEQLRSDLPAESDFNVYFEIIRRNSSRINQLISNLLNATRVNELSFIKISINAVIDNSLEFARDRIDLKRISVVKNYAKDVCPVFIDKEKVEIALLNIIVNAVEAMNDYGTLSISTQAKDDRCIVKISDTGKGMTREEINSLFEPFFTTKEKGTGLGLTNTQNIILAHNGSINVESEIDRGTTFQVSFNLA